MRRALWGLLGPLRRVAAARPLLASPRLVSFGIARPRGVSSRHPTSYISKCCNSTSQLAPQQYHSQADLALAELEELLEEMSMKLRDQSVDFECSQGVLNIKLGDKGSWVINKQAPNQELWWSSPISGPKRFRLSVPNDKVGGAAYWQDVRGAAPCLLELFQSEMNQALGPF